MIDNINSPKHYAANGVECIDAMRAISSDVSGQLTGYQCHLWLTAFKYLWRMCSKDTVLQNSKKARWYLDKLITDIENDGYDNEN
jgi:hypothetical protein